METLIEQKDFEIISGYIKSLCGREIPYIKEYLVRQKLDVLLQENHFNSFHDFAQHLNLHNKVDFNESIISAISVNETFFFRDEHPFIALEDCILKDIFSKKNYLNIWSAACSTGQEVYSIAMSIEKFLDRNPEFIEKKYRILATDIDKKVLGLISKEVAMKYCVMPFNIDGGILSIATANPFKVLQNQDFLQIGKYNVVIFISSKEKTERAIKHYYGRI